MPSARSPREGTSTSRRASGRGSSPAPAIRWSAPGPPLQARPLARAAVLQRSGRWVPFPDPTSRDPGTATTPSGGRCTTCTGSSSTPTGRGGSARSPAGATSPSSTASWPARGRDRCIHAQAGRRDRGLGQPAGGRSRVLPSDGVRREEGAGPQLRDRGLLPPARRLDRRGRDPITAERWRASSACRDRRRSPSSRRPAGSATWSWRAEPPSALPVLLRVERPRGAALVRDEPRGRRNPFAASIIPGLPHRKTWKFSGVISSPSSPRRLGRRGPPAGSRSALPGEILLSAGDDGQVGHVRAEAGEGGELVAVAEIQE